MVASGSTQRPQQTEVKSLHIKGPVEHIQVLPLATELWRSLSV